MIGGKIVLARNVKVVDPGKSYVIVSEENDERINENGKKHEEVSNDESTTVVNDEVREEERLDVRGKVQASLMIMVCM